MGEANHGHYYSFVEDRKTKMWYEFNDTVVKPFSPKNLEEEAFGGLPDWAIRKESSSSRSSAAG